MPYKTLITSVATLLTLGLVSTVSPLSANEKSDRNNSINTMLLTQNRDEVKFICREGYDKQTDESQYTTYVWTPEGKRAVIRWVKAWYNNTQWTPQTRCQTVSRKFQQAYENGSLKYIANGWENNQPVVCTARQKGGDCVTTLMTLRTEDDPIAMARNVASSLYGRGGITRHSANGKVQQYYEIDFEKFLKVAPIE